MKSIFDPMFEYGISFSTAHRKKIAHPQMDLGKVENWGPNAWRYLHSTSLSYPKNPTANEKARMKAYLFEFAHFLPCKLCSNDFIKFLETRLAEINVDLQKELKSRENFVMFIIDAHNYVNKKLNKKVYTYEQAVKVITTRCMEPNHAILLLIAIILLLLIYSTIRQRKACAQISQSCKLRYSGGDSS